MNKIDALNQVNEFHKTFNVPVLENPNIPSPQRCELRVNLLQEELNELNYAIENNDLVEVLDAFLDIQYVLSGAILEFGMQDVFNDGFNEVHRSNMSKACSSEDEAKQTLEHYKEKDGTEGYYKQDGDKWLVYRKSDNKVLKNKFYSGANLEQFLQC